MSDHLCLPSKCSNLHVDSRISDWPGSALELNKLAMWHIFIQQLKSAAYILIGELRNWRMQLEQGKGKEGEEGGFFVRGKYNSKNKKSL